MLRSQIQRERKGVLVFLRAERGGVGVEVEVEVGGEACRSCWMAGERARSSVKSSKSSGQSRSRGGVVGGDVDADADWAGTSWVGGVLRSCLSGRLAESGAHAESRRGLVVVFLEDLDALLVRWLIDKGESGKAVRF